MRCKVGDIAVFVEGAHIGKLVEVLAPAPVDPFILPSGGLHEGMHTSGCWVLKALGSPFEITAEMMGFDVRVQTLFPCAPDYKLRPLRGQLTPEDTHETIPERIIHGLS